MCVARGIVRRVSPRVVIEPEELRQLAEDARRQGRRVALVPTMGALHAGHLRLVEQAWKSPEKSGAREPLVIVSIFVNPTQFGPNEDFARYPRTLDADLAALDAAFPAASLVVFTPAASAMYPAGERTRVRVEGADLALCGRFRPGHFEGVATVVAKLFSLVGQCHAYFGEKDYQQLQVIRRMATDLLLPVQVQGVPIVREPDGLAMSSRNRYLSAAGRSRALVLVRALRAVDRAFRDGERDPRALEAILADALGTLDSLDYASVVDATTLEPFADRIDRPALAAIAGRIEQTRLIDNLQLGVDA